jgi:hypothetical protein
MTGLDIDITELKSRDLIKIFSMYPSGRIEIKFERVFWCSDYAEPVSQRDMPPAEAFDPRRPPQRQNTMNQASRTFEKMGDVLGSMMGPPRRR